MEHAPDSTYGGEESTSGIDWAAWRDKIFSYLGTIRRRVVMAALYGAILWLLRSPELRGFVAPALARLRRG